MLKRSKMFRMGSDQYTYRTVERRISTASVALGLARTSMPGRQYQLTNLKKFTRYSVVVQAYNVLGQGPMTPEVVATTLEDGKGKVNPYGWASLALSFPRNIFSLFLQIWCEAIKNAKEIRYEPLKPGQRLNERDSTTFKDSWTKIIPVVGEPIINSAMNTNSGVHPAEFRINNKFSNRVAWNWSACK